MLLMKRIFVSIFLSLVVAVLMMAKLAQQSPNSDKNTNDISFTYKTKSNTILNDPHFSSSSKAPKGKQSRYTSKTTRTTATTIKYVPKTTTKSTSSNFGLSFINQLQTGSVTAPPFTYSPERLNQSHAAMFKKWLEVKSDELYKLSINNSGFLILNTTYNYQLRKDANFAWINFTSMIVNISNTISEVLKKKTEVVKNLSEFVERAFDEFRNDTERLKKSVSYLYYDAKSPKTFCDVQETKNLQAAIKRNQTATTGATTLPSSVASSKTPKTKTTKSANTNSSSSTENAENIETDGTTEDRQTTVGDFQELKEFSIDSNNNKDPKYKLSNDSFRYKRSYSLLTDYFKNRVILGYDYDDQATFNSNQNNYVEKVYKYNNNPKKDLSKKTAATSNYKMELFFGDKFDEEKKCDLKHDSNEQIFWHKNHHHHNPRKHRKRNNEKPTATTRAPGGSKGTGKPGKTKSSGGGKTKVTRPGGKPNQSKTTKTTTTSAPYYDDLENERTDLEFYDDYLINSYDIEYGERSPFWNISCINRTFDENFKNFQKGVNRNLSTVHVPTNVYKQDILINMTAFWTEALNFPFKQNYDEDNELFWQYFCSTDGLFRRYPGAYWTVPQKEDFFDCRLQSWYIMAASSPKDVLILLDTSGSMTGLRLEIAKKLIESIMDTLTDNDFFNIFTFSNTVQYLMNLQNETQYRERFIQAGKTNKLRFIEKLKYFKSTSNIADFDKALKESFKFLYSNLSSYDSCECNKVIMIITDGSSENSEEVFREYNWDKGRKARVFTFLIGRDMTDPRQVEWMACANDGKSFHVATLADVNEHVHEYIPVLSRPAALKGLHETTWSNVFIGHLDKELKIAVARPAYISKDILLSKKEIFEKPERSKSKRFDLSMTTEVPKSTTENPIEKETYYDPDGEAKDTDYAKDEGTDEEEGEEGTSYDAYDGSELGSDAKVDENNIDQPPIVIEVDEDEEAEKDYQQRLKIYEALKKQQVLLGVVGVDVPVLRLISKVSPKYQMGVGIYIIMLDNNGFIVFHPSIRREITKGDFDYKGSSHSIDLDKFEIPIDNDDEFEDLEHEMIDQKTSNKTLKNWKREGLRVIKRSTEYVYTPVQDSPFSVAIASPSSFGRYYIDLPSSKEGEYENTIKEIHAHTKFETNIQLYNCTYNFAKLSEKLLNLSKAHPDYCIRYLFTDKDQVLAIKSDLVLHNIYYHLFNFSIFNVHKNLVKSSFYGTYSGITFYLPVIFYKNLTQNAAQTTPTTPKTPTKQATTVTQTTTTSTIQEVTSDFLDDTGPPSEMTVNIEFGSISEPSMLASTQPSFISSFHQNKASNLSSKYFNMSSNDTEVLALNLFSTESNKHTYSFEKQYYTRSIEFSDYLRTEFNTTEPFVIYFLNETSKDARRDTIGATLPIWLDKVPTAVAGVVYDAKLLQQFLFENYMDPNCVSGFCRNLCSQKRGMNVTCYLLDEHGIVILSTVERSNRREQIVGQPLYKVNPWLMKNLEKEGFFNLVIPGNKLQECRAPPRIRSGANMLTNFLNFIIKPLTVICYFMCDLIYSLLFYLFVLMFNGSYFLNNNNTENYNNNYVYLSMFAGAQQTREKSLSERIDLFNHEYRIKNSHCYYFGIYSFNIKKWKSLDASEFRVWCNSTQSPKQYLVGYFEYSNLIILVVEDEFELIYCGNITSQMPNNQQENAGMQVNSSNNSNRTILLGGSTTATATTTPIVASSTTAQPYFDEMPYMYANETDANFSNESITSLTSKRRDFTINRYRKKPPSCYNNFPDEKEYLSCNNKSPNSKYQLVAIGTSALNIFLFFLIFYSM